MLNSVLGQLKHDRLHFCCVYMCLSVFGQRNTQTCSRLMTERPDRSSPKEIHCTDCWCWKAHVLLISLWCVWAKTDRKFKHRVFLETNVLIITRPFQGMFITFISFSFTKMEMFAFWGYACFLRLCLFFFIKAITLFPPVFSIHP